MLDSRKAYTWFNNNYVLKKQSNGWYPFDCPFCPDGDGAAKMSVNFQYETCKCWVCGYKDRIAMFVSEVLDVSYFEAKEIIDSEKKSSITLETAGAIRVERKTALVSIEMPKGFKPLVGKSTVMRDRACAYLDGRGFDVEAMDAAGFGFCDVQHKDSEENFFGYIIVPFSKKGKIVYYLGRDYIGNFLRYKNPKEEICGVGKSELVFNEDALNIYNTCYLTEGWSDAVTMGNSGISTQGWSVSADQLFIINSSSCKNLVVLADVGFYQQAVSTAIKFMGNKKVTVVNFEAFGYTKESGKDANAIGRDKVMEMVKKSKVLTDLDVIKILG
jgi:hypothetical protein